VTGPSHQFEIVNWTSDWNGAFMLNCRKYDAWCGGRSSWANPGLSRCFRNGIERRLMSVGTTFFSHRPNLSAVATGLIVGMPIGVIGALTPAFRAAQIRIADSLRES
jgi:hypothetical protein